MKRAAPDSRERAGGHAAGGQSRDVEGASCVDHELRAAARAGACEQNTAAGVRGDGRRSCGA